LVRSGGAPKRRIILGQKYLEEFRRYLLGEEEGGADEEAQGSSEESGGHSQAPSRGLEGSDDSETPQCWTKGSHDEKASGISGEGRCYTPRSRGDSSRTGRASSAGRGGSERAGVTAR
jgi:hypothetical protein